MSAPLAFSGGVGWAQQGSTSEARVAAKIAAEEFGRPLRWVEDDSRDTRENAAKTIALLKPAGIQHIVLVTHGYHMRRALRAFSGLEIQTALASEQEILDAIERNYGESEQKVFLGEGDQQYHRMLNELRAQHPKRVGVTLGQHEPLAHLIEAGADVFLMPSLFEPCGLNQLYSLKYGTPPIVRTTGGLADTVVNATLENLADARATGFAFGDYTAHALYETVKWALTLYRDRPKDFQQIMRTAMAQNWSWDRSAEAYEKLYHKIIG